ncbi:MAG: hypothetical protein R3C44_13510 [Chloroflexota bacterium]
MKFRLLQEAPVEEDVAEPTAEVAEPAAEAPSSGLVIFTIGPAGSRVRFELDEDLRGQHTTVVSGD